MRQERPNRAITDHALARTQAELRRHDLPAALLFDAYNIRYVTGTSVMPVWSLHAMDRFALVPAEGRPLLWEYASVQPDASTNLGHDVRRARSWSVFDSGERSRDRAADFAAEVMVVLRDRGVDGNRVLLSSGPGPTRGSRTRRAAASSRATSLFRHRPDRPGGLPR
jgi:Xaa-Pro dipeptidase